MTAFWINIYATHITYFALHFSAEVLHVTFSLYVNLSLNYLY